MQAVPNYLKDGSELDSPDAKAGTPYGSYDGKSWFEQPKTLQVVPANHKQQEQLADGSTLLSVIGIEKKVRWIHV